MLSDLKEFNLHTYKPNLKNFRNFLVISCLFKTESVLGLRMWFRCESTYLPS